ncbi:flavodoxin family protein [Cellulosilyticum lentocellum]|uniref:NADPH-dependent FMN reductase n=1 Tax=Cellulosilyticum lentocellum (strain ATCC 49066 / DSM 5427 / NCIMB 11756 / RHM5) TaxID=642492 RepID=F2JQR1_CELLD|nr:NAD(P)H-dependent oxidoreductase [Cellulosilyticum lentocellum]ADZ82656.1 NADPH-dependent FMN reductase [Cellulosilyticum lentocellum DSM 5427]
MKVLIIYGTNRKGFTYKSMEVFKRELKQLAERLEEIEFEEVFVPEAMPYICSGCKTCLIRGIEYCPHSASMLPIIKQMREADGIIIASPTYVFDVTGGLKNVLDHLFTLWLSHRPEPIFFNKVGFSFATAAGAGMKNTHRTIRSTFKYLGFRKIYSFSVREAQYGQNVEGMRKKARKRAKIFYKALVHQNLGSTNLFRYIMMKLMAKMINTYNENGIVGLDKKYWKEKGWL